MKIYGINEEDILEGGLLTIDYQKPKTEKFLLKAIKSRRGTAFLFPATSFHSNEKLMEQYTSSYLQIFLKYICKYFSRDSFFYSFIVFSIEHLSLE